MHVFIIISAKKDKQVIIYRLPCNCTHRRPSLDPMGQRAVFRLRDIVTYCFQSSSFRIGIMELLIVKPPHTKQRHDGREDRSHQSGPLHSFQKLQRTLGCLFNGDLHTHIILELAAGLTMLNMFFDHRGGLCLGQFFKIGREQIPNYTAVKIRFTHCYHLR